MASNKITVKCLVRLNFENFSKFFKIWPYGGFCFKGMRVVGKGSWKGQLKRTRSRKVLSWKVLSWKVWSWKVTLKLESFAEVGKNRAKLERIKRNWKVSLEVRKFRCSWKVLAEFVKSAKLSNFRLSNLKLSNFSFFPTALPTSRIPFQVREFSVQFLNSAEI